MSGKLEILGEAQDEIDGDRGLVVVGGDETRPENPRRRCACGSALPAACGPFERDTCSGSGTFLSFSLGDFEFAGNVSAPTGPHAVAEPERRRGFSTALLRLS